MEKQIEMMQATIFALKQRMVEPPRKPAHQQPMPTASSSSKPMKAGGKSATVAGDDDVLTFEQKKDLSEAIQTLDGQKLERVIQIIHEGVPEIRNVRLPSFSGSPCQLLIHPLFYPQSTEEIELEIDLLPANVLAKLYNFVIRPLEAAQPKRALTGKGTGTGGLKRKSIDEDAEAEKIRILEERIALFEGNATVNHGNAGHGVAGANGGGRDS